MGFETHEVGLGNLPLREWSAADFSNFYNHYRRHLLAHAARHGDGQASEDVVQEAILYLLVSLPELETELDALRFTKWKIRMLAIDHARKSLGLSSDSLHNLEERAADESLEPLSVLERADDAAIVWAALARLPENQRDALTAVTLASASYKETAKRLQITEPALRQLLVRSRANFRMKLLDEASQRGVDVQEILSSTFRKIRTSSPRVLVAIGLVPIAAIALVWGTIESQLNPAGHMSAIPLASNSSPGVVKVEQDNAPTQEEPLSQGGSAGQIIVESSNASHVPLTSAEPDSTLEGFWPNSIETVKSEDLAARPIENSVEGVSEVDILVDEMQFVLTQFLVPSEEANLHPVLNGSKAQQNLNAGLALNISFTSLSEELQFSISSMENDLGLILVPEATHTRLTEIGDEGGFRLDFIGSGMRAADLSGEFSNLAVSSGSLKPMYFQGHIQVVGEEVISHQVRFFPQRNS